MNSAAGDSRKVASLTHLRYLSSMNEPRRHYALTDYSAIEIRLSEIYRGVFP